MHKREMDTLVKKMIGSKKKFSVQLLFIFNIAIGLIALFWFLVRVVPKPSRASYPCQRAAFPLASAVIVWIFGFFSSVFFFRKGRKWFNSGKYKSGFVLIMLSLILYGILTLNGIDNLALANKLAEIKTSPPLKAIVANDVTIADPQATVGMLKSSIDHAENLTYSDIKKMVTEVVELAGGLTEIVHDGDTVILKPNLVLNRVAGTGDKIPLEVNGITTDWRIVRAVSEIVRELNPSGKIFVMEGSAQSTQELFDEMNYNKTSMPEVDEFFQIENISGSWGEYNSPKLQIVKLPEGKNLYPDYLKPYNSPEYYLNKLYYNADVIISITLVKNHESASVTGSIKNLAIGTTPANIYGGSPDNYTRNGIDHSNFIHEFIHDNYMCRPADFAIIDGLQGLEFGPISLSYMQSYEENKKNMRMMMAGKDLVALDAIEALLIQYDPEKVNYLTYLHNDGIGCADTRLIKIKGNVNLADERIDFKHQQALWPKFIDTIPPSFQISDTKLLNNNQLLVILNSPQNLSKMEVKINNLDLNSIYINNFDSLLIDISALNISSELSVSLKGFNKYLSYTSRDTTIIVNTLSKTTVSENVDICFYPSSKELTVKGYGYFKRVIIYDMMGKVIRKFDTGYSNNYSIPLEDLPQGIYIVRINKKDGVWMSKKIVIE